MRRLSCVDFLSLFNDLLFLSSHKRKRFLSFSFVAASALNHNSVQNEGERAQNSQKGEEEEKTRKRESDVKKGKGGEEGENSIQGGNGSKRMRGKSCAARLFVLPFPLL